mmetsp:Transcript_123179/g.394538  ORF Transcript_123179/g.394538 Transcript_123179/m.394538 type:complete len:204 (-) Transcript_123179:67-678(-)
MQKSSVARRTSSYRECSRSCVRSSSAAMVAWARSSSPKSCVFWMRTRLTTRLWTASGLLWAPRRTAVSSSRSSCLGSPSTTGRPLRKRWRFKTCTREGEAPPPATEPESESARMVWATLRVPLCPMSRLSCLHTVSWRSHPASTLTPLPAPSPLCPRRASTPAPPCDVMPSSRLVRAKRHAQSRPSWIGYVQPSFRCVKSEHC